MKNFPSDLSGGPARVCSCRGAVSVSMDCAVVKTHRRTRQQTGFDQGGTHKSEWPHQERWRFTRRMSARERWELRRSRLNELDHVELEKETGFSGRDYSLEQMLAV
jgi:hypothetical protein